MNAKRLWGAALLLGFLAVYGCSCEERTSRRFPKIEFPDAEGNEKSLVDFGTVQVDLEHLTQLKVRNGGASPLNLLELSTTAPFGVKTALPLSIEAGEEALVELSYLPAVPNQRNTAKLKVVSDDPARPEVLLDLAGTGIQAVAVATPNPIDFGDVYLKETKQLTLTVSNAGSNALEVKAAVFSAEVPAAPVLTAELSKLEGSLGAGESVAVQLTFAPTQMGAFSGALELVLDEVQGGKVSIPLTGRGVISLPRACFQFDGEGTATCTDPADPAPNLQVRFGALCDNRLYPADGGQPQACDATTGQRTGRLWFENLGNYPVSYSAQYTPYTYVKDRCDAGYPIESDFVFSNATPQSDGGMPTQYATPTVKLPLNENVAQPWESAKVSVTYHAKSRCRDEATDLSRVVWTRQGEAASRLPATILVTFDGTSKLPRAVASEWNCGSLGNAQNTPCASAFFGVNNAGDAPLTISGVDLQWETSDPNGGTDIDGSMQTCTGDNSLISVCARFGWDGGTPNATAPHQLAATTNPAQPTQKQLGLLVFGPQGAGNAPDGGSCISTGRACPNQLYTIWAEVSTDDPYSPKTLVKIQGVAAPPP